MFPRPRPGGSCAEVGEKEVVRGFGETPRRSVILSAETVSPAAPSNVGLLQEQGGSLFFLSRSGLKGGYRMLCRSALGFRLFLIGSRTSGIVSNAVASFVVAPRDRHMWGQLFQLLLTSWKFCRVNVISL
ncbi:hypothetical protein Mapa_001587 [Marchantia paleacea]|nr:hypothetical protein Mapa_001587 [Marchantia paleacea]